MSQSTRDVALRMRPLLDAVAPDRGESMRLFRYLATRVAIEDGTLQPLDGEDGPFLKVLDHITGEERYVRHPTNLPPELESLLAAEYRRRSSEPLAMMDSAPFHALFAASHCARCRWQGEEFRQFHLECRYAGYPTNFTRAEDAPEDDEEAV